MSGSGGLEGLRGPEFADDDRHDGARALKERLYVAIVGLSILVAISEHDDHVSPPAVAAALTIGVLASVLAAVLAEVVAHMTVHRHPPSGIEVLDIVRSAFWALLVVVIPLCLLGLAGLDIIEPDTALSAASWAIVISLGIITYLSIRRSTLSPLAQGALLAVTLAFGAVVVQLQVLAHG